MKELAQCSAQGLWLCLECNGVAYGWAHGAPCIYCDSADVVGTDAAYSTPGGEKHYRLVYYTQSRWTELASSARKRHQSVKQLLAAGSHSDVILTRSEEVSEGKLVLLRRHPAQSNVATDR